MKNMNEEIKKVNGAQELDDDMLDGVVGGLVQLGQDLLAFGCLHIELY